MGFGPQRAANGVWIPSLRACTTCLCSWPDRNERVEIKRQGHSAAPHLDQSGFIRTYLIIPSCCWRERSEWGLRGRTGTCIHRRDHSGQGRSDLISNTYRSCRGHQGQAFSYSPFPRVSHAIIFNENIQVIYILHSARHQDATIVHISNCNQPAVFLMHCHLL